MSKKQEFSERQRQRILSIRPQLRAVFARYGVANPRIFGSIARGDAHEGSDVDILIDKHNIKSLMDYVAMEQELGRLIGMPVEVVDKRHIKPNRLPYIMNAEMLPL